MLTSAMSNMSKPRKAPVSWIFAPNGMTEMEISAAGKRDDRRQQVQRTVNPRRHQVFFQEQLRSVGQGLQQAERADARGSPAVLDAADDLAFEQHGVRNRREQDDQHNDDLDSAEDEKK